MYNTVVKTKKKIEKPLIFLSRLSMTKLYCVTAKQWQSVILRRVEKLSAQ